MLKFVGKYKIWNKYLYSLKVSLHITFNYNGKNTFIVGKPCRYHHNKLVEIYIIICIIFISLIGHMDTLNHWDLKQWERKNTTLLEILFPKIHSMISTMRKPQNSEKLKHTQQSVSLALFKCENFDKTNAKEIIFL